jgi:hypothetical protein
MADFASRISGSLLLLALSGSLASAAELKFTNADESRVEFERSVKPFLAKHCVECHGAKDPEGELDLTTLDPDMKASASGARCGGLGGDDRLGTRRVETRQPEFHAPGRVRWWCSATSVAS